MSELPGEWGVPLLQRGDRAEVRLSGGRTILLRVARDGDALIVTAGPGLDLKDPMGNRFYTTDLVALARGDAEGGDPT